MEIYWAISYELTLVMFSEEGGEIASFLSARILISCGKLKLIMWTSCIDDFPVVDGHSVNIKISPHDFLTFTE